LTQPIQHLWVFCREQQEAIHALEAENPKIEGHPWLGESGLWFVPVHHDGNQNASKEADRGRRSERLS
jgi:hypothetical protein